MILDLNIIEKIKKLLSLSSSSNESESQLAMLKAQEMLAKYKLSIKEVNEIKVANSNIKNIRTKIAFTKAKWKANLASTIADNYCCYCYFKTYHTHTIVFLGKEEDVTVCNIILEYAVDCIYSTVKSIKYEYVKNGYLTKGIENDYAMGFIEGLEKKFNKQKEAHQEWGLVLVKDEDVIDTYNNLNFRKSINTDTEFQGYSEVYEQGIKDGEKFSISDKIAESNDETPTLSYCCKE